MKKLKYFYMGNTITMDYSQENESIAAAEADNNEFTVEDDGNTESPNPTLDERLKVLEQAIDHLKVILPSLKTFSALSEAAYQNGAVRKMRTAPFSFFKHFRHRYKSSVLPLCQFALCKRQDLPNVRQQHHPRMISQIRSTSAISRSAYSGRVNTRSAMYLATGVFSAPAVARSA